MINNCLTEHADSGSAPAGPRTDPTTILDRYFAEIGRYPQLTREEETRLAREAQDGRARSLERLLESNLQFVVNIARQYRNYGLPLEDLISEGNLGLMEAAQRFDPERGVKFISWAVWWIRNSIRKALSRDARVVRLPISQIKKIRTVRAAEKSLKEDLGRDPTDDELAKALPGNNSRMDPIHRYGIRVSSFDEPIAENGGESLAARMEDTSRPTVEQQMLEDEATNALGTLCERLNDRQRSVIYRRFGMGGEKPQSLKEVGERLGLSREGVRLIENKALKQLRKLFAAGDFTSPKRLEPPTPFPARTEVASLVDPLRVNDDYNNAA